MERDEEDDEYDGDWEELGGPDETEAIEMNDELSSVSAEDIASDEERVAAVTSRIFRVARQTFPVEIVDSINGDEFQAVALGESKRLQLTRKLVQRLNDDELAWVVGHEVAHFEHRDQERLRELREKLIEEMGRKMEKRDQDMQAEGYGAITRSIAIVATGVTSTAARVVKTHAASREHETEADARAIEIVRRAGYDSNNCLGALEEFYGGHLPSTSDRSWINAILATHPDPHSRVERLKKLNERQG